MAAGDVFSGGPTSVAAAGFLTIQPAAGVEAVITNIYHDGPVELYFSDGTTDLKFDFDTAYGVFRNLGVQVTNSRYLKVKNTDTVARNIAYDGIQTK